MQSEPAKPNGKGGKPINKYKRILAIFVAVLIAVMSVYPVFAQGTDSHSISVVNTVGLDNVHIAINQYDIVDGEHREIAANPIVVPSQVLHRVCEITNLANEAWIRVKVVYADDAPDVGDNFLIISSDKWIKRGEYYYCTESVPNNGVVEFFSGINIPADWDSSYAGKKISFTVYADAVQEQNFTPDFSKDNEEPWFGTIIEHRIHDDYIVPRNTGNQNFQIIYKDGAEGLVKVGDDFFSNWSILMPGDVVTDKVFIRNNYALPTTIFFQINDIDDSALLEKIQIRIYTDEGDIYNGSLKGNVRNEIKLVTLSQGEELVMHYELTVPAELTNEFSLANTKTEWVFRAYAENMEPPSPDATSAVAPNNPTGWNGWPGTSTIQTGDVPIMLSVGIAVVFCIIAIFVFMRKGGKDNGKS